MITRDASITGVELIRDDPALARGLFDDAMALLANGDPGPARLLLRDLVKGTMGFEPLSRSTGIPAKSLHRMLSARGNPAMDNLSAIFNTLREALGVKAMEAA